MIGDQSLATGNDVGRLVSKKPGGPYHRFQFRRLGKGKGRGIGVPAKESGRHPVHPQIGALCREDGCHQQLQRGVMIEGTASLRIERLQEVEDVGDPVFLLALLGFDRTRKGCRDTVWEARLLAAMGDFARKFEIFAASLLGFSQSGWFFRFGFFHAFVPIKRMIRRYQDLPFYFRICLMRLIGITADPQKADTFVGYLVQMGKAAIVRPEADQFAVWVYDEALAKEARLDWQRFVAHPDHEDFRIQTLPPPEVLLPELTTGDNLQTPALPRPSWQPTSAILAASAVAVTILTWFGEDRDDLFKRITFGPLAPGEAFPLAFDWAQPWRAITPVFLHFTFIHLVFNLLMFHDLGCQVEKKLGRWQFLGMFLAFAACANFAEAAFGPLRFFGGLSGVVYGFLGFVWVQTLSSTPKGYHLRGATILILLAWFALGIVQIDLPVTNFANGGGLVAGMVLGGLELMLVATKK